MPSSWQPVEGLLASTFLLGPTLSLFPGNREKENPLYAVGCVVRTLRTVSPLNLYGKKNKVLSEQKMVAFQA